MNSAPRQRIMSIVYGEMRPCSCLVEPRAMFSHHVLQYTCPNVHIHCHLSKCSYPLPLVQMFISTATCPNVHIHCHLSKCSYPLPLVQMFISTATCPNLHIHCNQLFSIIIKIAQTIFIYIELLN